MASSDDVTQEVAGRPSLGGVPLPVVVEEGDEYDDDDDDEDNDDGGGGDDDDDDDGIRALAGKVAICKAVVCDGDDVTRLLERFVPTPSVSADS